MPDHGGNIAQAARRWGIPAEEWLDLSTGISPFPYPVPAISPDIWRRLPHRGEALLEAAKDYYGTGELIALPGSQAAIQVLPRILCLDAAATNVSIVAPMFNEHPHAWRLAGARVSVIEPAAVLDAADHTDVLLLANPNNPTGDTWTANTLLAAHEKLARRGRWLVVDEAFIDATPEASLATHAGRPGLVVLRSLGKFFALAGARVGFALAPAEVRERLAREIGPWAVAAPSEVVATHALRNTGYQAATRAHLADASARLQRELESRGFAEDGMTQFFAWVRHEEARDIQSQLAARGILIRVFDEPLSFRIGLPGSDAEWKRFLEGLDHVSHLHARR
jgi:cobalamin biosynthetic protein CobC